MTLTVTVPQISANEDNVVLAAWTRPEASAVRRGDVICVVESTKATMEIEAETEGFLRPLQPVGARVAVGSVIGAITETPDEPTDALLAPPATPTTDRFTKKAALTAKRLGVDLEALVVRLGRRVTEADVLAAPREASGGADLLEDRFAATRPERVLLLGGGAGAGVITLDAIRRAGGRPAPGVARPQRAAAILDNDSAKHGRTVAGVPVLGGFERARALLDDGAYDAAVLCVTGNPAERARLFEAMRADGIPFTNVIDPTVDVAGHVQLGVGNLVMAHVFLGACARLGDNNFLASHVCIEHHCEIGSHSTFGPRTTASGAVTVGDRVKVGMVVAIEPYVTVGSDSVIASGCTLTTSLPAGARVKAQVSHVVRTEPS